MVLESLSWWNTTPGTKNMAIPHQKIVHVNNGVQQISETSWTCMQCVTVAWMEKNFINLSQTKIITKQLRTDWHEWATRIAQEQVLERATRLYTQRSLHCKKQRDKVSEFCKKIERRETGRNMQTSRLPLIGAFTLSMWKCCIFWKTKL